MDWARNFDLRKVTRVYWFKEMRHTSRGSINRGRGPGQQKPKPATAKCKLGKAGTRDWIRRPCELEPLIQNWQEFVSRHIPRKTVHVVTDGGANPNPGPAGWGAIIRQNGVFTWTYAQYDNALNNTMELMAVVEE
jgi:hypothetical protein